MKYLFVGGKYHGQEMSKDEVLKISNGKFSDDLSGLRSQGILVHRVELDNQPLVDGYLSPMWDGGKIRYETFEVYDMLSR